MLELPFTTDQFFAVFREYNRAIWPAPVLAYVLGLLAVALATWKTTFSNWVISLILALSWLWIGLIYHGAHFSAINPAAYLFGILFVIQGILFVLLPLRKTAWEFRFRRDAYGAVGAALILYSMVIYPLLGAFSGHAYPNAPMFGVAPCPSAIFTFGLLLWTVGRVPVWILLIPGTWAAIGSTAAWKLGVAEDFGLLVAGLLGVALVVHRNRQLQKTGAMAPA